MHDEELFYLRLLLCHITCGEVQAPYALTVSQLRGASATFKQACIDRGLASDDREWEFALSEAAAFRFPAELREMFLWILVFNSPVNPHALLTYSGSRLSIGDMNHTRRCRGMLLALAVNDSCWSAYSLSLILLKRSRPPDFHYVKRNSAYRQ